MKKKYINGLFAGFGMLMGAVMFVACSSNEDIVSERARVQKNLKINAPKISAIVPTRSYAQVDTLRLEPLEGSGPALIVAIGKNDNRIGTRVSESDFLSLKKTCTVWDWLETAQGQRLDNPALQNNNSAVSWDEDSYAYIVDYSHYDPRDGEQAVAFGNLSVLPQGCNVDVTSQMPSSKGTTFEVGMENGYVEQVQSTDFPFFLGCFKANTEVDEATAFSCSLPFFSFNFELTPSEKLKEKWGTIEKVKVSDCYKHVSCSFTEFNETETSSTFSVIDQMSSSMIKTFSSPISVEMNFPQPDPNGTIQASMSVLRESLLQGTLKLVFSKSNDSGQHPTVTYDLTRLLSFDNVYILDIVLEKY